MRQSGERDGIHVLASALLVRTNSKAISYELAEQFGWKPFNWIFVPTGSGCLATNIWKGFRDLNEIGFIDFYPRIVIVQPKGNSPLVRAILQKKSFLR